MFRRKVAPVLPDQFDALSFVMAGLARLAESCDSLDESVQCHLQANASEIVAERGNLIARFREYLNEPNEADVALAELACTFRFHPAEVLAIRLTVAAEQDLLIGHVLSHLQTPLAMSRPTIGLIAQAYCGEDFHHAIHVVGQGNAVRCGALELVGDELTLPERQVRIPLPTALSIQGIESSWPGTSLASFDRYEIPLGKTNCSRAATLSRCLRDLEGNGPILVIRTGDIREARAAATYLSVLCGARALLIQGDHLMGLAPWLSLNGLIPVFSQWLVPGERKSVPAIPGFLGLSIVLCGPEGDFEAGDRPLFDWRIEMPPARERIELWNEALDDTELSLRLGSEHRHAAGRIAALSAMARQEKAAGRKDDGPVTYADIRRFSRQGDSVGLGALAELIPDEVGDEALVASASLKQELESLVTRCKLREEFVHALGPSMQARYRASVRALFVGPSGTGKTLTVAWLATRLGMPLFRVDLSAITSKYIGETEKNLSQLLARAEQNEVLLLFDEADSLFGKRTDVHDANDRFANAQTNYLLQRLESFDGITVLTSNGRNRFDDSFSRRFDAILSFPLPGPEERRALWDAHLGSSHGASAGQLNLLAAVAELTGGQIRNAVLRSAVDAALDRGSIQFQHLLTGIAHEYMKLSRQLPNELKQAQIVARAPGVL